MKTIRKLAACLIWSVALATQGPMPSLAQTAATTPAQTPAAPAPAPAATVQTPSAAAPSEKPSELSGKTLKVAMRVVTPFVFRKDDGSITGFSFELWKQIELATGLKTELQVVTTLPDLLGAVKSQQADLGIAAISITAKRELEYDFSQPMFDSGLLIAVRADSASNAGAFSAIQRMMTSGPILNLLGILAMLILIPAHLVWLSERHKEASKIASRAYFPGILQSIWWATGAAGGQQQDYPHSVLGKIISAIYVFISVIFVAYFTAAVASAMTVAQLKGDIAGPQDLPGRKVGVVVKSTAGDVVRGIGAKTTEFPQITDAYEALYKKQIDAIVYDAPVLLYYAAHDGQNKLEIAGSLFHRENYGILFAQGSPLRKPVNEALLRLRENGLYDALYTKWFAAGGSGN